MENDRLKEISLKAIHDAAEYAFRDHKKATESYRFIIYDFDQKKHKKRKLPFMK
tara:strand:- start:354 stop:515 length:162 start_codon:yes stop_codon:yes gene_type:complete